MDIIFVTHEMAYDVRFACTKHPATMCSMHTVLQFKIPPLLTQSINLPTLCAIHTQLSRDQRAAAPPRGVNFEPGTNTATLPPPFRLLGLQQRESDLKSEMEIWNGVMTVHKRGNDDQRGSIYVLVKSPEADKEEDRSIPTTIPRVSVFSSRTMLLCIIED